MSMNNLTIDGEFRYIIKWFMEWSELQRDDFIPIVADYITDKNEASSLSETVNVVNMNGLHGNEKPMSLFQCRVKLFNQWNKKWPQDFKEKLQEKITEIDSKVGEKIKESINLKFNGGGGSLTNGHDCEPYLEVTTNDHQHVNGIQRKVEDQQQQQQQQVAHDVVVITNSVTLIDPMQEVLSNETSVDDIEPNEGQKQQANSSKETAKDNSNVARVNVINEDCTRESSSYTTRLNDGYYDVGDQQTRKPVEQVVHIENLQINEEADHEDVTASMEKPQQQSHTAATPSVTAITAPVTVTVNPVVVVTAQTLNAQNAEVPLVV